MVAYDESEEELEIVTGDLEPQQDEPLASDGEDADLDGLTPVVLEARFEHRIAVCQWLVNF